MGTALVVTSNPDAVKQVILHGMEREVTGLPARGGFTGEARTVLDCVFSRSEIPQIKALVREADSQAFMVIGHAYEALGEGFLPLDR